MTKKSIAKIIITIIVAVLSFATINQGFYVDENGLLSLYRGIYQGQHMFVDSWESLQTGGFLTLPIFALYYQLLEPFLTPMGVGLVLYTRILYVIVRALIALYLYYSIRKSSFENGAFAASMFYYMFIVAWRNFSYKSFCDFAIILIVCCIFRYFETEKIRYFVFIGIATCIAILAYPTMIVMAFVIGVALIVEIKTHDLRPACLVAFVVTCVVCGAGFITYLALTTGLGNMFAQLQYLGDQDYDYSFLMRIARMLVSYVVFAVIAYIPVLVIHVIKKFRWMTEKIEYILLTIYWALFFVGMCVLRFESISTARYVYALLVVFFWFPYFMHEEKENNYTTIGTYGIGRYGERKVLWMIFQLSIVVQAIWAVSTNQEISVPGHMAIYGVIAVILLVSEQEWAANILVVSILVVDLFFLAFWLPESNGGYSDVLENRYWVTHGAYTGIALDEEFYNLNESCYELDTNYLSGEDKLLVAFGANSSGYLNTDATIAAHTVFARTQVNTKVLEYWEVNPENQADYVMIDTAHPKYEDFVNRDTGKYIMENYTVEIARAGNVVLLGR